MGCPGVGPCATWDLDLSCYLTPSGTVPDPCLLDGEPVPEEIIDNSKLAASQLLWALTGRQFGCCSAVIRPCRKKCEDVCCVPNSGFPWSPVHLDDGTWTNIACDCNGSCSCTNLYEINLPSPVCYVSEVKIDGEIVDPTTYQIYDFRKLVRLGSDIWPECNNLTKADTEIGTWSVAVTYGRIVPPLVKIAAEEMASEIIKSCVGKACRLPQRVSSVTRQGISVSFLDDMQFLDRGLTGLYFVDLAARTYNPKNLSRRPTVYSPDSANQWRVTTWDSSDPVTGCG